jgi:hypothetical protein
MCPSEKKAPKLAWGATRDTFSSPVCEEDSRNCGHFSLCSEEYSRISLHLRLYGGAERIRTLGTGLKPVRADVSVSYAESGASIILSDCLLAVQLSLTGEILEGVRRRILGDSGENVVTSELLNQPDWVGV